jgi:adenosylmethionine-8-amino-7-oxononanoate aminotransferase
MSVHRYPRGAVFYRNLFASYAVIRNGRGVFLYDQEGRRYLDASGGAAVVNIGHGVEAVSAAMERQARRVAYLNGMQFSHEPVERLARGVARFLPFPEGKVYFLSSGSEAVEASLKLARQYWVEKGRRTKRRFISRTPSYHGNTLAALSLSARRHYQDTFRPMLNESLKVPAPYCYRCYRGESYPRCGVKCAGELDKAIRKLGKENVAAFVTEIIGGATTGAAVPPPEYFPIVREICDRNEILLVADEVMTGMGRTGRWLASSHFGLVPDIVVLGKGLTGGYFPLSAVAAGKNLVDVLYGKGSSFLHAQTFAHHPVGCAAGATVLDILREKKLVERCARRGAELLGGLAPFLSHPHVGDIRGKGLLIGIEFVSDKRSKKPFPRKIGYAERFLDEARRRGLVFWWNTGQADGVNGDLILLAPPFNISRREIALLLDKMGGVFSAMSKIV